MKKLMTIAVMMMIGTMAMATTNEITAYVSLNVKKNSLEISKTPGNQLIQMLGTKFFSQTYSLTTTNQPMSKGALGNLGWCYMRNLSQQTTNAPINVNISFDIGVTTNMQLLPTEAQLFRLAPSFQVTNIHAAVSSGSGDFEFTLIEK